MKIISKHGGIYARGDGESHGFSVHSLGNVMIRKEHENHASADRVGGDAPAEINPDGSTGWYTDGHHLFWRTTTGECVTGLGF